MNSRVFDRIAATVRPLIGPLSAALVLGGAVQFAAAIPVWPFGLLPNIVRMALIMFAFPAFAMLFVELEARP